MADAKQNIEVAGTSNSEFIGASQLEIRLDTRKLLLRDVEFYLRGLEENFYFDSRSQTVQSQLRKNGIPMMNKIGIQAVLNFCRFLLNTQTVQGNFDEKRYLYFMAEKRIELMKLLAFNSENWELPYDSSISEITDNVMNAVEPVMSRTIGNKEREGFNTAVKSVESNKISSGGFNLFGGGQ